MRGVLHFFSVFFASIVEGVEALTIVLAVGNTLTGVSMKHFQERVSVQNTVITVPKYKDTYEEVFA